jgi:16S rRNA (cytosine1402-N4)-methyltransferase
MEKAFPKGSASTVHVPVLFDAVLAAFAPLENKVFVDATLGGGGHTRGLLEGGAAKVLGLDWDAAALARCEPLVKEFAGRLQIFHTPYNAVADVVRAHAPGGADGILIDAGFSSDQLDDPTRGLSYHTEGPLDMRLNSLASHTAADILNTAREEELADIFYQLGEEPKSRPLARLIVTTRKHKPFETTKDLLQAIEAIYPPRFGLKRAHPAARIFQALRVAVNEELEVLEQALNAGAASLKPGGRLAIITFQPLEERLVKKVFRACCEDTLDDIGRVAEEAPFKQMPKRMATAAEEAVNPRARSAILRVLERKAE